MDVVYVNDRDEIMGSGSIQNAVDNGIIVRIARVFLTNRKGELLLQKRSERMRSLPGKWDQTAAGHVDEGEDYAVAASRELAEEMGIKGVELHEITKFYGEEKDETKTKKRFSKLFMGTYDGEVKIDNDEVSDFQWINPSDLSRQMARNPDNFTEGFIEAFKLYQKATANQQKSR